MVRTIISLLLVVGSAAAPGAAQPTTPQPGESSLYDTSDWVLLGSLFVAQLVLIPLDDDAREIAFESRGDTSDDLADMLRPLGRTVDLAAAGAATYVLGTAISNRRVADFGLHAFVSLALSNFVSGALKVVTGRARPNTPEPDGTWIRRNPDEWDFFGGWGDDGPRRAYPSGHSSNAFTIATVFAEELGSTAGWVAYPLAAGVAWSRVNDEVHWLSDVVMGALVGIAAGQLVVRHGHRRDGLLERVLLEPSLDRLDIRVQIPAP